jgi:protein-disulfide isomerase
MKQKNLSRIFFTAVLLFSVNTFNINSAYAEGISKQQGDAILQELQKIRLLLEQNNIKAKSGTSNVRVLATGASVIGRANAPITLVEYTDYQCPYCYRFFKNTYPLLKKKYIDTGKLKLVIKDLPLGFHAHAMKAAQAARCAGDQKKFLAMHEILYKNSKKLDIKYMPKYAQQAGLNVKSVNACLASNTHIAAINKEMAEAESVDVKGTPTFVLGKTDGKSVYGKKIVGAKSINDFERYIGELVKSLTK